MADAARACVIKGNIAKDGTLIYYLPWHPEYANVQINERRGERWFCDDGEALRAG